MMKRHTRPEVEAMSLSERVRKGSELWQDGHPLPFAPETTEIETPQRFEEKVGEQMLYLIEQLDKLSVAEREKYLEEQRQVAEERVKMALASVKQGSENVTPSEVSVARRANPEFEAALRLSAGQLSDAPAALSSRS